MNNNLTEMQCKNAEPSYKPYKLFDGKGLYLEVTPKSSKLWRLKFHHLNRERRLALGSYPEITLKKRLFVACLIYPFETKF